MSKVLYCQVYLLVNWRRILQLLLKVKLKVQNRKRGQWKKKSVYLKKGAKSNLKVSIVNCFIMF